jgi:hypothetical protein
LPSSTDDPDEFEAYLEIDWEVIKYSAVADCRGIRGRQGREIGFVRVGAVDNNRELLGVALWIITASPMALRALRRFIVIAM